VPADEPSPRKRYWKQIKVTVFAVAVIVTVVATVVFVALSLG